MIQDIFPKKLNNQYNNDVKPNSSDIVLNIISDEILIRSDMYEKSVIEFPTVSDFNNNLEFTYLFSIDQIRYFLCDKKVMIDNYEYANLRRIRKDNISPDFEIFAAHTGKHLADWYRDNKFCGRCASSMNHSSTERAMVCPDCGYTAYPRIMPAVIVGVINGDSILITRYKTGFKHNALIAGFTEIGETLEETVKREVMEEAGVNVKNIRYYKSQPWGIANDILVGFYCDVDGDSRINMDSNELKYADWVVRDEIELQPDNFSLTNEMMKMFKDGNI